MLLWTDQSGLVPCYVRVKGKSHLTRFEQKTNGARNCDMKISEKKFI